MCLADGGAAAVADGKFIVTKDRRRRLRMSFNRRLGQLAYYRLHVVYGITASSEVDVDFNGTVTSALDCQFKHRGIVHKNNTRLIRIS